MGGTGVKAACALLVAALTIPLGGAEWTQSGGGAAKTGSAGSGPSQPEVAFRLDLGQTVIAEPLVVGRSAFVATASSESAGRLWRVDVDLASATVLAELPARPGALAFDDGTVVVAFEQKQPGGPALARPGLAAYPAGGGPPRWERPTPAPLRDSASGLWETYGVSIAVHEGLVIMGGSQYSSGPVVCVHCDSRSFVAAWDVETGTLRWAWFQDAFDQLAAGAAPGAPDAVPAYHTISNFMGLAVLGGRILVAVQEVPTYAEMENAVYALSVDGTVLWARRSSVGVAPETIAPPPSIPISRVRTGPPTGSQTLVVAKLDDLFALVPETGQTIWRVPTPREQQAVGYGSIPTSIALGSSHAFTTHRHGIVGADLATRASWSFFDDAHIWLDSNIVVLDAWTLVGAWTSEGSLLRAFPHHGGPPAWTIAFPPGVVAPSGVRTAAGDTFVITAAGSIVVVVGRTSASIQVDLSLNNRYPAPGHVVVADLAGTKPGVFGPPTQVMIDWGDGQPDVQAWSPTLEHTYASPCSCVLRLEASNPAGQTSIVTALLEVGGTDVAAAARLHEDVARFAEENSRLEEENKALEEFQREHSLTPLQVAFAPENQDKTFFVIGLFLSGLGVALGLGRNRLRRIRLAAELRSLQNEWWPVRQRPELALPILAARRKRADLLLGRGKLHQAEYLAIVSRLDDLGRRLDPPRPALPSDPA